MLTSSLNNSLISSATSYYSRNSLTEIYTVMRAPETKANLIPLSQNNTLLSMRLHSKEREKVCTIAYL